LTNGDVQKIAAAERHAMARNWPVTIVIFDDGGHLLGLNRLAGATLAQLLCRCRDRRRRR
jgi:glc operon protein GlcG